MKIYEYEFFNLGGETYIDEEIRSEVSINRYFYTYWFGDISDYICDIYSLNNILESSYFRCLKKLSKNQLNKLRAFYGNESI